jgi:hypothetical protein
LQDGCVLEAGRVCDYVDITDEDDPMERIAGLGVTVVDELVDLWPAAHNALDDAAVWEVVLDHLDEDTLPF